VGAVIGGVINLVSSYLTAKATNSEFTFADAVAAGATGALSGALTASGLPVWAISVINGGAALAASIGSDAFSGRDIDVEKAYMASSCAIISSFIGGDGIRHASSKYSQAIQTAKHAGTIVKNTARGIARKMAAKAENLAWKTVSNVYFKESMKQLGVATITMPGSAIATAFFG
jgi:hypothetical protein